MPLRLEVSVLQAPFPMRVIQAGFPRMFRGSHIIARLTATIDYRGIALIHGMLSGYRDPYRRSLTNDMSLTVFAWSCDLCHQGFHFIGYVTICGGYQFWAYNLHELPTMRRLQGRDSDEE